MVNPLRVLENRDVLLCYTKHSNFVNKMLSSCNVSEIVALRTLFTTRNEVGARLCFYTCL